MAYAIWNAEAYGWYVIQSAWTHTNRVWTQGSAVVPGEMVKSIKRSQSDEKRLRNRENVMMKFTN
jgi:hypothetical protein